MAIFDSIVNFWNELGLLAIPALAVALVFVLVLVIKRLWNVCGPNEILVFSGWKRVRVVQGGGLRMPFFEKVDRMSLNLIEVPIAIRGAFSKGGIPLNVDAIANVKIARDGAVVNNAIERFLGRDTNEIRRVAKETLEGHLRGVLARLTPEEVNEDRLKFGEELQVESEHDLRKLGIHLDVFKIQHVSDEKHYLDSIGREAISRVIRDAEIAESDAEREAEQIEAAAKARGTVRLSEADAAIVRLANDLRKYTAEVDAQVKAEEERTSAAAREARAKAEQELQQVRAELETIRLQVDQVLPAEAALRAQEFRAKGDASIIRERGNAVGEAMLTLNKAWQEAGDNALSIFLIEDLEKILAAAAVGIKKIQVEELHMIDGGDGRVLSGYLSAYPAMLKTMFDAVETTTGIDIPRALSGKTQEAQS